ncbi:MAG TPA: nodulation protein NfeD [Terriglobia bacterium]|nr:nodulation protein NfeD [Terriglobia bacterium]
MRKIQLLILILLALPIGSQSQAATPAATIVRIDMDNVVHPVSADYVRQGLTHAKEIGARAVILRIDTPGGLVDSMRDMVGAILDSDVPVITWVGPNGSRAASAGFFVLLAGDVATMSPGTNTGAAHPVSGSGAKIEDVMEKKVVSDITAYMRSYVTKRGRNVAMAEQGVVESRSFTAQEAADQKLIDGVVNDVPDIIRRFDGREIRRFNGSTSRLDLAGATIENYEMSARQRLLSHALDPNLALVLGLIGLLGLYFELTHPGMILPGVAGSICLILSMFAFNLLPVNWAGAALILLAIVLFVLEASITSHGVLGLGGIVAMIAGASMLVEGPIPELRIHLATTIAVTLPLAGITVFLVRLALASRRLKTITGEEGMIGEMGVAKSDVFTNGRVLVHGESWNASSPVPIAAGAAVRVVKVHGLKVEVEEEKRTL